MSEYDVELQSVTKRFGEIAAVDDVSFGIRKGEFFSLLGPSGCGKTTIMRMISGFESPTAGRILIGGEDMAGRPPYRRPTNLVFQHLSLFPHMTVFRNIAFGLESKRMPEAEIEQRVEKMFDLIQMRGFGDRRISQISGGQQQRVAIARALVREPTVLLLDEPLGALDLKLREQMQLELKRIQREIGTTFIYVTHDQKEAITMSNRIAVMNHGRVEQIGDADAIYENPRTSFVANFIGATNLFEGNVLERRDGRAKVESEGLVMDVADREGGASNGEVHVSVRPEKIVIGERLEDLPNIYDGTVEEVIYQGASTDYRVRVGGRLVSVSVQNSEMSRGFATGAAVQVGWTPDKGVLIPGEAG
ncbi:MAG: ABC transporter ATP-binding protein [Pseudomonadota bacterium]